MVYMIKNKYHYLFDRYSPSVFTHPGNVCMSYFNHLSFSLKLGMKLATGSVKAFIHAVYPDIFVTSTSDLLVTIKKDMDSVGC
jgi:hypothetical protein